MLNEVVINERLLFKFLRVFRFITRASVGKPEPGARVKKYKRFRRQKGGHGPRRSIRRPRKLGMRQNS